MSFWTALGRLCLICFSIDARAAAQDRRIPCALWCESCRSAVIRSATVGKYGSNAECLCIATAYCYLIAGFSGLLEFPATSRLVCTRGRPFHFALNQQAQTVLKSLSQLRRQ